MDAHHHNDTTDLLDCTVLVPAAVTAACIVFCCYSYYYWRSQGTAKKRDRVVSAPIEQAVLPPGSLGWPFLGETVEFISAAYSVRPESFMDKRRLKYGKVFRSHLFGSPTIVSTDADFSRAVLQSDASSFVPSYPRSLTDLMGESSILLINGALHRRVHGLVGAFLKSDRVRAQVADDVGRYTRQEMAGWEDGTVVLVQHVAKQIAFQVLVRILIGLDPEQPEMGELKREFRDFIAGLMSLPVNIPGSQLRRSLQAKQRMVSLVKRLIADRRSNSGVNNPSQPLPRDVMGVLLSDGELSDDLIADNMIDLMIPGEDSVPILITLAIKYLSGSPEALKEVEDENRRLLFPSDDEDGGDELDDIEVVNKKNNPSSSWLDFMSRLPFTQNVVSETLRLGNIISGVIRRAVRDVEVKGHLVPEGWCVLTYFRSIHLDDEHYDDPHKFDPWRWQQQRSSIGTSGSCTANTSCNSNSTLSFTPFGGGQRLCPGLDLARLEAAIFLHHLITGFTWEAEEDTVVCFPTVRMKRKMPIRVTRRRKTMTTGVLGGDDESAVSTDRS